MPFLLYLLLLVQIAVVIVGGLRYRNLPRPLRVLEWLLIFTVVEAGIEWVLAYLNRQNFWIFHFSTLIECVFLFYIFFFWIKHFQGRVIVLISLVMFIVLWIISKFSFEPLSLADDWTASIVKVLQTAFSAYLLVDIVKGSNVVWINDPRVWVVSGIIIYAAGSLFMFALFNKMLEISPSRLLQIWSLNWILMIISNLLFARGFLCKS